MWKTRKIVLLSKNTNHVVFVKRVRAHHRRAPRGRITFRLSNGSRRVSRMRCTVIFWATNFPLVVGSLYSIQYLRLHTDTRVMGRRSKISECTTTIRTGYSIISCTDHREIINCSSDGRHPGAYCNRDVFRLLLTILYISDISIAA